MANERTFRGRWSRRVRGVLMVSVFGLAAAAPFLPEAHGGSARPSVDEPAGGVTTSVGPRPSHHRLYRAEVTETSRGIALDRPSDWTVRFTGADGGPVVGGRVEAALWQVDEDSPLRPIAVTPLDDQGSFRLQRVHLDRPGWWNVKLTVDSPLGVDSLAFNVIVNGPPQVEDPEVAEDGRSPESEFGLGPNVSSGGSYIATLHPVEPLAKRKLQRVHVEVVDAEGRPVEDAAITVDGGMPEHGHGLPTRPKVTGRTADGLYVIDGLRFNMGGWWVLELAITAVQGSETVTFHLEL